MHSPYLVTTHRYFCPSCRREVEDEEMVTNEDELQVHLHCATVVDLEGHRCEAVGLTGRDLADLAPSAGWLAEQQRILARLAPRGGRGETKKMKGADAQSVLRDLASDLPQISRDAPASSVRAQVVGEAKRRACEESQLREAAEDA